MKLVDLGELGTGSLRLQNEVPYKWFGNNSTFHACTGWIRHLTLKFCNFKAYEIMQ